MIQSMYAIFDSKAAAFMQPFTSANDSTAVRAVRQAMAGEHTQLARFPEDFTLHKLGTFDDEKGTLVGGSVPVTVCTISALKERQDAS